MITLAALTLCPGCCHQDCGSCIVKKFKSEVLVGAGETMDKLNNSMKLSDVNVDDYLAFYIPGGHGQQSTLLHAGL